MVRAELPAIAVGVLIAAVIFLAAYSGYLRWDIPARSSLGPEWNCADVPFADACVKRVQKAPQ
jgi:hypothetical protein